MISLVVAHGENREIGLENKLLWKLPKDMERFVRITSGGVVLMGRKTFESIGKPLKHRHNLVTSRNFPLTEGVGLVNLDEDFETILRYSRNRELFIIGGETLYKAFLPYADRLYITKVKGTFKADTFFPPYAHLLDQYRKLEEYFVKSDENHQFDMEFTTYEKISKKV